MISTKLDAIKMHKFIKENLHHDCVCVDLRPTQYDSKSLKYGIIYIKTEDGNEANFIMFNDEKFCISTSNKTKNEKLNSMSTEQINKIWQQYLCLTFGASYMLSKSLKEEKSK